MKSSSIFASSSRNCLIISTFLGCAVFSFVAQAQYSPPLSGMVSWWRAEGNANDSADGNNGTALNGAGYAAGMFGQAFSFDGVNDHVRVAHSANLIPATGITVSAWVYPVTGGGNHEIISKWDAVPVGQRCYDLKILDGKGDFGLSSGGVDGPGSVLTTSPLPLNTWTHLAGTYDGSNVKIYMNGVFVAQTAFAGGLFAGTDDLGIGGAVGGTSPGSGISFLQGRIDEAIIYNRALTASEIQILANVPEPASSALLIMGAVCFFSRNIVRKRVGL